MTTPVAPPYPVNTSTRTEYRDGLMRYVHEITYKWDYKQPFEAEITPQALPPAGYRLEDLSQSTGPEPFVRVTERYVREENWIMRGMPWEYGDVAAYWESTSLADLPDGSEVLSWPDLGPNSFDLTGTSGSAPTIVSNAKNGQPGVRFVGSQALTFGPAFTFQDDSYTAYALYKVISYPTYDEINILAYHSPVTVGFRIYDDGVPVYEGRFTAPTGFATIRGDVDTSADYAAIITPVVRDIYASMWQNGDFHSRMYVANFAPATVESYRVGGSSAGGEFILLSAGLFYNVHGGLTIRSIMRRWNQVYGTAFTT